jgi:hypothetical protein
MVIAVLVISLLAILLAPILLVRFCKRPVAAFHRAITNRIATRFAARLPGFAVLGGTFSETNDEALAPPEFLSFCRLRRAASHLHRLIGSLIAGNAAVERLRNLLTIG